MKTPSARGLARLGPRGTFGVALLAAAEENDRILALTADLAITAGLERFRQQRPERLINVGIAEQNLIGVAAGLADDGWQPFAATFANFAAMRSCEFVRHHMGYMRTPVVAVGIGAGFAMGQFGTTHYSLEDVSTLRAVPNISIVSPGDCTEVFEAVQYLAANPSPVYLRLSGVPSMRPVPQEGSFVLGKARTISTGNDVTLVAWGSMLGVATQAREHLTEQGLSVGVVNMHTVKPLDEETLKALVGETAAVVTVEEHSVVGGLGSAVSEYYSATSSAPPVLRIGVPDQFPKVGSYDYVLAQCGLTAHSVAEQVLTWFNSGAVRSPLIPA